MNNTPTSIQDVLSGNAPVKVSVSIDYYSAMFLGLAVMVGVAIALIVYKKI